MGTSKVNSSRKTVLQREWDSKINVTMPAGHTLPLTFAFDLTASNFRNRWFLSGSGSDLNLVVPVPHPWLEESGIGNESVLIQLAQCWFPGTGRAVEMLRHEEAIASSLCDRWKNGIGVITHELTFN